MRAPLAGRAGLGLDRKEAVEQTAVEALLIVRVRLDHSCAPRECTIGWASIGQRMHY